MRLVACLTISTKLPIREGPHLRQHSWGQVQVVGDFGETDYTTAVDSEPSASTTLSGRLFLAIEPGEASHCLFFLCKVEETVRIKKYLLQKMESNCMDYENSH